MNKKQFNRRDFIKKVGLGTAILSLPGVFSRCTKTTEKPNILWLSCEDISPHLGCYGYDNAITPNLDKLASKGALYENAFTTAPVCAPNRSSIITGLYSTTLGTHNMRAGGEGVKYSDFPEKPDSIKLFSEYLRSAGYYCTNNDKEDYQFDTPESAWDESSKSAHWRNRPEGKPFFAVFNIHKSHESTLRSTGKDFKEETPSLQAAERQDPEKLSPPPYYPDTDLTHRVWANYYETITAVDHWVGDMLKQLQEDGLADNTIVFFWSDHGVGLPRAKRCIYDSGTHVPLIVYAPPKYQDKLNIKPGTRIDQLISSFDLGPTVMDISGLNIPDYMQGQSFLGENVEERDYVFSTRDRMDDRYDMIRTIRDKRFRYIFNFEPFKPYIQYMNTPEKGAIMQQLRKLHKEGKLSGDAARLMASSKPQQELYDTAKDPHEINNLANKPEYQEIQSEMRQKLFKWMIETRDLGLIPEPELVKYEKKFGSRYAIKQHLGKEFWQELQKVAVLSGKPSVRDIGKLISYLDHDNASIKFWALIGLGNLGKKAIPELDKIKIYINDQAAIVRVATARALFKMEKSEDKALSTLIQELQSEQEWIRLRAAIYLDNIGEKARPAIPYLKKALDDVHNKYVVRVANRALNQLLGTDNKVR